MPSIATNRRVDRAELKAFTRPRHHGVLLITRADNGPQSSLVTVGLGHNGDILVASYPERVKCLNIRRNPRASMTVMSDAFNDEWVQVDGHATVIDLPEALDGLVEYFQVIKGDHDDWDAYRQAMIAQGKVLIRLQIKRWGPHPQRQISRPPHQEQLVLHTATGSSVDSALFCDNTRMLPNT